MKAFPVVFFDGNREVNVGDVRVNPEQQYKPFQLMLSKKIGTSRNQISTYLIDRKRKLRSPEERWRIPITSKFNFASVCLEKDYYFLVVLKKSRKSKNRRARATTNGADEFSHSPAPENLILLRRSQPKEFDDQFDLRDLNGQMQRLSVRGNVNSPDIGSDPGPNSYPDPLDYIKAFCQECWNAKNSGMTSFQFHPCVNDAVITRFTSRLGPINRPNKPLFP